MPHENTTNKKKTLQSLDKHWHLASNDDEIGLTEFEFAFFRGYAAFSRWTDDCAVCCHTSKENCNGMDYSVLNIVRMHERTKSVSDIARLMNRDDLSNIQYCIRKLVKAGLIEKHGGSNSGSNHKKGVTYQVSEQGIEATERYAAFRRELLMPLIQSLSNSNERMNQLTEMLSLLSGIYDQAACIAATHRTAENES